MKRGRMAPVGFSALMDTQSNEVLTIKGWLPLSWTIAQRGDLRDREQVMAANESLLRVLSTLEESRRTYGEDLDHQSVDALGRMEAKLNLMLAYVSQLLTHYRPLPGSVHAVLHGDRLGWTAPDGPALGAYVRIELYLNPQTASPLVFFGCVTEHQRTAEGVHLEVHFDSLGEAVQSELDRLIFRHHRREIRRQRGQPEEGAATPPKS